MGDFGHGHGLTSRPDSLRAFEFVVSSNPDAAWLLIGFCLNYFG